MKDDPNPPAPDPAQPSQDRAEAIFDAALDLPPAQRAAYLDKACRQDAGLRRHVENLLKAHENAGEFLAQPAAPPRNQTIAISLPPEEQAGDLIGRYKILQKIGEGGCGVVYMAEQEVPVRRRVALKVIKLGMDTKSVVARFEAERQALAMMDHPNIAKVLDAGATETGRPFFVMELVRGIRITEYCDQNKLPTRARLELFIQVCNAIQHAHQKGIIHRDIKPSNILVTLHDGTPVPKVIDFGIAKATQGRLTDQTLFTAFEQFIGTPAYMSPEQAEMSGLDVDTRCDIYALGVLLYELLTGRTPFDAKELLKSGLDELRRTIREKEPERPSTRLSTMLNADLTEVAMRRQSEVPKLINLLQGDLDWIVMKSLEKDRTRRFETANAMAMDIQRYLTNEPVLARPPSNLYRFQKLFRRNRAILTAIGAGVAALILGLALSLYLFVQERAARQRAEVAEKEQALLRQKAEDGAAMGAKITRAGLLLTRNEPDQAEKIISEVPPHATLVPMYSYFGEVHARHVEWPLAITNYSLITKLAPDDPLAYLQLAPILLYVGDADGYRSCREVILKQFGATTSGVLARDMAAVCSLQPASSADLATIGRVVDLMLAREEPSGGIRFIRGLAAYRGGNFAAAEGSLHETPDPKDDPERAVEVLAVRAMTQYQLHNIEAAHADLSNSIAIARDKLPRPGKDHLGDNWTSWIMAQCLMREAGSMMPDVPGAQAATLTSESEPSWLAALAQAGLKFTHSPADDNTWEVLLDNQPITDLTPLHGAAISKLSLMRTQVSDLTPLRGMPLKTLRLAGTKVSDLTPLHGMPMESLQLSGTPVSDLGPLRGVPLRTLNMTDCPGLTNMEPIAATMTLRSVILPPNAKDFGFLRTFTNLARLSFHYDPTLKAPAQTAAEFWAEFDKTNSAAQAAPAQQ